MTDPVLPYTTADGESTAGWSGSDTSHERATREANDGTQSERQRRVLDFITSRRGLGVTWRELSDTLGMHHGKASGVLSVLHKHGAIARLSQRRNLCKIYVHPHYIDGRVTESQGRRRRVEVETVEVVEPVVLSQAEIDAIEQIRAQMARFQSLMVCVDTDTMSVVLRLLDRIGTP